jgi:hypothetical protein
MFISDTTTAVNVYIIIIIGTNEEVIFVIFYIPPNIIGDVKNTSIIPIYLDNFVFDMKIGDYQPAKNLKAITNIKLDDTKELTVPIACNLDSITTRRALQKTIEKNAGKVIKKLLDTTPVSKEAYGDDIKAVSKIKGNANMHVRLFGYALKFSKPCDHN